VVESPNAVDAQFELQLRGPSCDYRQSRETLFAISRSAEDCAEMNWPIVWSMDHRLEPSYNHRPN